MKIWISRLVIALVLCSVALSSLIKRPGCKPIRTCKETPFARFRDWAGAIVPGENMLHNVLLCMEKEYLCGYIPAVRVDDELKPVSHRGVTISRGIDLGNLNEEDLKKVLSEYPHIVSEDTNKTESLIQKVKPFLGKTEGDAVDLLLNKIDLELDIEESEILYKAFYQRRYNAFVKNYLQEEIEKGKTFPDCAVAAAFSYMWQLDTTRSINDEIIHGDYWTALKEQHWKKMIQVLEHDTYPERERRKKEKLILLSCLQKCTKPMDIFFLIDESATIGEQGFNQAKTLIEQYVRKHDIGINQTRIGIATTRVNFTQLVPLEDGINSERLLQAMSQVNYTSKGAKLGGALENVINSLIPVTRFDLSVPMTVVVLTNGVGITDHGALLLAIQKAKSAGIQTLAIGIGDAVNRPELLIIANQDSSRVFDMNLFTDVTVFGPLLGSTLCHLVVSAPLIDVINGTISPTRDPEYYSFKFDSTQNIEIIVTPKDGEHVRKLDLYASFDDPIPDHISNHMRHEGRANDQFKRMILAPSRMNISRKELERRKLQDSVGDKTVYVAVRGPPNVTYIITANECDQNDCKPGTNRYHRSWASSPIWKIFFAVVLLILVVSLITAFIRRRKVARDSYRLQPEPLPHTLA